MTNPYLTLPSFTRLAITEKNKYNRDCVIIIYGRPRSGKTTIGLHILSEYFKKLHNWKGDGFFNSKKIWGEAFDNNFATSSQEAKNMFKDFSYDDFVFVDEGIDVASYHQQMTREQSNFFQLLQKTGEKRLLTIFITPSYKLLTKDILRRAHYMFVINRNPRVRKEKGESKATGNEALLYRNFEDPIRAEANPFGLNELFKKASKNKMMPLKHLYYKSRCMVGKMRFRWIDKDIYELYRKKIKIPQINKSYSRGSVSRKKYNKLRYRLLTLLNNLYKKHTDNYSKISRLCYDKWGNKLASPQTIKKLIEQYQALEEPLKKQN